MTDRTDIDLDAAFADLRRQHAQPSPDLVARILADAAEAMPAPAPAPRRRRWFTGLRLPFEWQAGAALTASAFLGLAVGLSGLADPLATGTFLSADDVALIDGYSAWLDDVEGEG